MRIRGFENTNRFYKSDGWDRYKIAELITHKSDFANVLRKIEEKYDVNVSTDDLVSTMMFRQTYYIVFDRHVIFDGEKIKEHEYIPFSGNEEDKEFSSRNECE